MEQKIVIYQLLPRLFSNTCDKCVINGSIEENGCGKMNDITATVLKEIKSLGATHVWYTGVIEHATQTDYSYYGIRPDNKHIVKGKAVVYNSKNCYIKSNHKVVCCADVDDLVVVEEDDIILIMKKEKSQNVKKIIEKIKEENLKELL